MKYYSIKNETLYLKDSTQTILIMPIIAVILSAISASLQLVSRDLSEMDAITIMLVIILFSCIAVLTWSLFKKTYREQIQVDELAAIKNSKLNSSVFYLELKNGRQRNLSQIKNKKSALELLDLLRQESEEITADFA